MIAESGRLLLVEDDLTLGKMVDDFLTGHGFRVRWESNGLRALGLIDSEHFDVLILDIGLPGMDGIEICRTVRDRFSGSIIMLTARGDEIDEVVCLEVGADDYIAKPVRPRALLARLKVHLRRGKVQGKPTEASRLEINGLIIDANSRTVRQRTELGKENILTVTTAEFDLLLFLMRSAGEVVGRNEIYEHIQGIAYDGVDRSIDLRVSRLRKKLGDDPSNPKRIKSVRGVGYIFALEP
ncbi:MAG: response regulator transcription factor [Planctomycetaceae bacterium]|nr:response regulator transcription factor [Planctomycetaceae bacterium]MCP4478766.1 response regulator transcription factor [Planctomycetaceae bacterium]MCP4774527.1 response regulator transcription factor [Planctomycetaceae bacterium]